MGMTWAQGLIKDEETVSEIIKTLHVSTCLDHLGLDKDGTF